MPKPLKIIGYWTSDRFKNDYYYKRYPNPKDWVDENWDNEIRQKVIEYLDNGINHNYQRGSSRCRICGCYNGSGEFSDGVYLWPEGLSHYLKEHDVRLPDRLVKHFLTNKFDKNTLEKELRVKNYYDRGISYDSWLQFKFWKENENSRWRIMPNVGEEEENTLILIGFWKNDRHPMDEDTLYPHPQGFIDENWDVEIKQSVINYMKTCTVIDSEPIHSYDKCLFTGKTISYRVLSDGHFFFPENYIYYIETQNVKPLDFFVEHCLKHKNVWKDNIIDIDYDIEIDWWESLRFTF